MNTVSFNENLIPGSGNGLLAFVRHGLFWHYTRHSNPRKPGLWEVTIGASNHDEFWPLLTNESFAVVDDFGNLVRVQ